MVNCKRHTTLYNPPSPTTCRQSGKKDTSSCVYGTLTVIELKYFRKYPVFAVPKFYLLKKQNKAGTAVTHPWGCVSAIPCDVSRWRIGLLSPIPSLVLCACVRGIPPPSDENPKVVCGSILTVGGNIVLGRRAIEPRRGFWGIPAGVTSSDAAL